MKVKNLEMEDLFGKINKENVFIGNIMKCTEYDVTNVLVTEDMFERCSYGYIKTSKELYKENQILIRICNNPEVYVELKNMKNFCSYINIYNQVDDNGITVNNIVLPTSASYSGEVYVDRESLKPYYEEKGKVKIRKIKWDVFSNSRLRGRIEN